jgi:hydroxybutyrate-dimer hydrolase
VSAAAVANADAKLLDALEAELGKRPESLRTCALHARHRRASTETRPTACSPWSTCARPAAASALQRHARARLRRLLPTQDLRRHSDDLLTAGYGKTGLGSAVATYRQCAGNAAELRRYAIQQLPRPVDANKATGGYGTLYGPNIDINGSDTLGEGKIAGTEAIAYSGR